MGVEAVITIFAVASQQEFAGNVLELLPSVVESANLPVQAVGVHAVHIASLVGLQLTILQSSRLQNL